MKPNPSTHNGEAAFNVMELCVVLACVAIMAVLVLPAMGSNKAPSASAGCLYNLRHLQTGCAMYSAENNDYLMPNAPLGTPASAGWCSGMIGENWTASTDNTNPVAYTSALLWPYVGNDLNAYRCPGDVIPSANGIRLRSYSMNGQMGAAHDSAARDNPGYLTYVKSSDIIRPTPANAFVFADESMVTLNDGYLQIDASGSQDFFPDVPACYLEGGCGFSFADGHAEIHRWQTPALRIPTVPGVGYGGAGTLPTGVNLNNVDWIWFTQHATSH